MLKECKKHGVTEHAERNHRKGTYRCKKCTSEAVSKHRKDKRKKLVEAAGGKCSMCGYDKCIQALHFHHLDPSTKLFEISGKGQTYSIERMRKEVEKCVLLCSNCHTEVEAGITMVGA